MKFEIISEEEHEIRKPYLERLDVLIKMYEEGAITKTELLNQIHDFYLKQNKNP